MSFLVPKNCHHEWINVLFSKKNLNSHFWLKFRYTFRRADNKYAL